MGRVASREHKVEAGAEWSPKRPWDRPKPSEQCWEEGDTRLRSRHSLEWNSRTELNLIFQVVKNNAVTDQEKREKKIVVKKLAEMEEELKVEVEFKYNLSFFELDILFLFSASCVIGKLNRPGMEFQMVLIRINTFSERLWTSSNRTTQDCEMRTRPF